MDSTTPTTSNNMLAPLLAVLLCASLFFSMLQRCSAQVAWQQTLYETVDGTSETISLGTGYTCISMYCCSEDACSDSFRLIHLRNNAAWGDTVTVDACTGYNPPCQSGMVYGDVKVYRGSCTKVRVYAWRQK